MNTIMEHRNTRSSHHLTGIHIYFTLDNFIHNTEIQSFNFSATTPSTLTTMLQVATSAPLISATPSLRED